MSDILPGYGDRSRGLAAFLLRHRILLCLLALVAIGLVLRLYGLDARGMSHPEIYIPGIDLPPGISEPPARRDFLSALAFHYHDEPHPLGWYLAMFGWTKAFGTSEWVLRLPSVLFGVASIPVLYRLGATVFDRATGLGAAAILSVHGMHVFWSQAARMYVPGFFFAALSMLLLLECVYGARRRPWAEIGYVATVWAGIETTDLFWPFLVFQVAWALMALPAETRFRLADAVRLRVSGVHRMIQIQAVALMISAPELLHSIYLARHNAAAPPSLAFLRDYVSLGFLSTRDDNAVVEGWGWQLLRLALLLLCLALIVTALRRQEPARAALRPGPALPRWLPFAVALAMTPLMVWLALIATHRNGPLLVIAAGPLLALTLPAISRLVTGLAGRLRPGLPQRWQGDGPRLMLVVIGLVGPVLLYLLSFKMSVLAPRAFLVFVPAVLVLTAAGAAALARGRLSEPALALGLTVLAAGGLPYMMTDPGSPRDYRGLGLALGAALEPGDLVLVRNRNWQDTPLFYYLPGADYVTQDYRAALAAHPGARVWVVSWPYKGPDQPQSELLDADLMAALDGWTRVGEVTARRARAEAYEAPK